MYIENKTEKKNIYLQRHKTQNRKMKSQKLGGYPKFVKIITNVDVSSGVILTNRDLINGEYKLIKTIKKTINKLTKIELYETREFIKIAEQKQIDFD